MGADPRSWTEVTGTDRAYLELRKRLDEDPLGFPATGSALDLRVLEALFTPEEAGAYLELGATLEAPAALARRVGGDAGRLAGVLEGLWCKGLVRRSGREQTAWYAALPFLLGAFEFQLRSKDAGFGLLFDRFFQEAYGEGGVSIDEPVRVVPVRGSVDESAPMTVGEYPSALASDDGAIAVSRCICRAEQKLLGRGCERPMEVCFQFGKRAHQVVEDGTGRLLTRDEAIDMLDACGRAGLVPLALAVEGASSLCNCCGDCCAILRAIKLDPTPARRVSADHRAEVAPEECSACSACLDRCQMGALAMGGAVGPAVDRKRCIGCGLCVAACPSGALSLRKKPDSECEAVVARGGYLMQLVRQELREFIVRLESGASAASREATKECRPPHGRRA